MVEKVTISEQSDKSQLISLGNISGVFGVKGWIKVHSFTDPREKIVEYGAWQIKHQGKWQEVKLSAGKRQGKTIVVKLIGLDDRDEAMLYQGDEIAIYPQQLDPLKSGEYYWHQLTGLAVLTSKGVDLGKVDHLLETGANDVLVVRGDRERLIPFTMGNAVISVNLQTETITVDWDPDF
ncbi:16S rRNA processing protein RimM [hydrothermal vent metagenome]|uniref:16S rRNA processing protein RimM n=1 Tax=hydrothermal vent metagenome TaxID=652676 RepID=A0A3B0WDE4_9ZZZZ